MAVGDTTERIRDEADRVSPASDLDDPPVKPYVPAHVEMAEFTWSAVLVGALLGILFGASSLYLVLKVGMTVSASIPVAVLSITLFRVFSRVFGVRRTTILENNIVQTTGSAGESDRVRRGRDDSRVDAVGLRHGSHARDDRRACSADCWAF